MTPILLITATMLACDLNGDSRIDGRDIAECLAAWNATTSPQLMAGILANYGDAWIPESSIQSLGDGSTWAAAADRPWRFVVSPFPGQVRLEVYDQDVSDWRGNTRERWLAVDGSQ